MDASTRKEDFSLVLSVLLEKRLSITELITALLTNKQFKKHLLTKDLLKNAKTTIKHILDHTGLPEDARDMACVLAEPIYAREIQTLADNPIWHFSAL
jgi:hypothetical protein